MGPVLQPVLSRLKILVSSASKKKTILWNSVFTISKNYLKFLVDEFFPLAFARTSGFFIWNCSDFLFQKAIHQSFPGILPFPTGQPIHPHVSSATTRGSSSIDNPFGINLTKWSDILKQFVAKNQWIVFKHCVELVLKGQKQILSYHCQIDQDDIFYLPSDWPKKVVNLSGSNSKQQQLMFLILQAELLSECLLQNTFYFLGHSFVPSKIWRIGLLSNRLPRLKLLSLQHKASQSTKTLKHLNM